MKRQLACLLVIWVAACKGDTGPAGTNGTNGTNGSNGANGATGPMGTAGTPGSTGAMGTPGATGATGTAVVISERAQQGLDISPVPLKLAGLSGAQIEQIGQGSYIVNAVSDCSGCHSPGNDPSQFLVGGVSFPLSVTPEITFYSRNLTPDPTTGMTLTEDQFVKVFREGRDFRPGAEGEALVVMPWYYFRWLGTDDIKAVYAYLRAIPPQMNATPADVRGPLAALTPVTYTGTTFTMGAQPRPLPPETDITGAPIADPDHLRRGMAIHELADISQVNSLSPADQRLYARGSYLANSASFCSFCHSNPNINFTPGANQFALDTSAHDSGGGIQFVPPPLQPLFGQTRTMHANLTGLNHGFFNRPVGTLFNFLNIIDNQVFEDGSPLGFPMNVIAYRLSQLTDEDQVAIYTYMKTMSANEPQTGAADKLIQRPARYCTTATQAADCKSGETCHEDMNIGNECVGGSCQTDQDCGACQTCTSLHCAAPADNSTCVSSGI
jgi:hypothetical protein